VDQVPVSVNVSSPLEDSVVTLAPQSVVPLSCQIFDRNGYQVTRDLPLVRSVKGTISGTGCLDARAIRSGYDTLVFSVGSLQTRVPVIVATALDSVGVIIDAPLFPTDSRIRFLGEELDKPLVNALEPLVRDILASYGSPTTNLDRARALRDWVARTAVSPDPAVHPSASTANLSVLPLGKTWGDVNGVLSMEEWDRDAEFWSGQYYDGYQMLDRLLGTLD